jgi:hypothetical protein
MNRFLCDDATCNVVTSAGTPLDPGAVAAATPVVPASASSRRRARSHGHVKMHVRRSRHGVWKVRLRATGSGRGVVVVRCRRHRHGQVRTVLSRSTRLPRTLHGRVRCKASRPRAKLLLARR